MASPAGPPPSVLHPVVSRNLRALSSVPSELRSAKRTASVSTSITFRDTTGPDAAEAESSSSLSKLPFPCPNSMVIPSRHPCATRLWAASMARDSSFGSTLPHLAKRSEAGPGSDAGTTSGDARHHAARRCTKAARPALDWPRVSPPAPRTEATTRSASPGAPPTISPLGEVGEAPPSSVPTASARER